MWEGEGGGVVRVGGWVEEGVWGGTTPSYLHALLFQITNGFTLPLPLNLIFLPLTIVE